MSKGVNPEFSYPEFICPRMHYQPVELMVLQRARPGDESGQLYPVAVFDCTGQEECGITPKHGTPDWSMCPGRAEIMAGKPDDIEPVVSFFACRPFSSSVDNDDEEQSTDNVYVDEYECVDQPAGDEPC